MADMYARHLNRRVHGKLVQNATIAFASNLMKAEFAWNTQNKADLATGANEPGKFVL
jgi:hypothetical protein